MLFVCEDFFFLRIVGTTFIFGLPSEINFLVVSSLQGSAKTVTFFCHTSFPQESEENSFEVVHQVETIQ